jgi:hypothetical protein
MVLADMMLRMGRMGSDGARIRTLGAELVISSAVTAGDDAIRAGRCSLAVIFTLLLLPLLITLRIFESPTPEDAAVADISDLGAAPLWTTVMEDDEQLVTIGGAIFFELDSRDWFALPIASPEDNNSDVLSPANCSLLDDMYWGVMLLPLARIDENACSTAKTKTIIEE